MTLRLIAPVYPQRTNPGREPERERERERERGGGHVETRFCMFKVVSHNSARFIDQMAKQQKLTVTRAGSN